MVHNPVLLKEVIEYLDPKPGDNIIDATLDGGGHSAAILEKIEPNGKILGIEIDPELVSAAKLKIKNEKLKNLIIVNDSCVNIEKIVREHNFRPNGILFDLGLSSWHYERSGRGFSFKKEGEPLDMRFSPTGLKSPKFQEPSSKQTLTAAEIVNTK